MYTGLLHFHSFMRWIALITLVLAVFKAFMNMRDGKTYMDSDKKPFLFAFISAHIQLLLGLILYFISPVVAGGLSDMKAAMADKVLRFWAVEHIAMMILAIVFITVGFSTHKKIQDSKAKFRRVFIFYLVALVLILASIPWPFMQVGQGRGWF